MLVITIIHHDTNVETILTYASSCLKADKSRETLTAISLEIDIQGIINHLTLDTHRFEDLQIKMKGVDH